MQENSRLAIQAAARAPGEADPTMTGRRRSGAIRPLQPVQQSPFRVIAKKMAGDGIKKVIRQARTIKYHYEELSKNRWQDSVVLGQAIDSTGPVPWVTYPALKFINRLVQPYHKVFEYGCGNSSLWWSRKVQSVVAVEHSPAWAQNIQAQAPSHLSVALRQMNDATDPEFLPLVEEFFARKPELPVSGYPDHDIDNGLVCREFAAYATEIGKYGREHFDIVVIDGMARGLSTWMAVNFIKKNGFIIFDNSDRWQYNCAFRILSECGFKRIDFHGLGPGRAIEWCTTVYLRNLDAVPAAGELTVGQEADLGW